jgi:hypothetical protein
MPVVAVNDFWFPVVPAKLNRAIGKQRKPPVLIFAIVDPAKSLAGSKKTAMTRKSLI